MSYSETERQKAIAIVSIFETGRPFGEYSALAVLNDGAGISYGFSQFTHRSGSLAVVVERYLTSGCVVGRGVLRDHFGLLGRTTPAAIRAAAQNEQLKNALRAAGTTIEMRRAQHLAADELYLAPAIKACEGSGFVLPLSLAVIYDSINHGSWEMIRDRVRPVPGAGGVAFEKAWITAYVRERHAWLRSVPRLRSTAYRTTFFLAQIIAANWQLDLPLTVHGYSLKENSLPPVSSGATASAAGHSPRSAETSNVLPDPPATERRAAFPANARPPKDQPSVLETVEKEVGDAAAYYDRFETVIRTILTRSDAAKSLWTTVAGTAWQAFWAVASFVIGLPREVWLTVAFIAAALMVIYLYRQFALGRIREMHGLLFLTPPAERQHKSARNNNE